MPSRVTAILVDYAQADLVARGIASVGRQYDRDLLDVVVLDNSESEANAQHLRRLARRNVGLIVNPRNLGYPAACNLGAEAAVGDYILLVNPDIQWHQPGALRRMVAFLDAHPAAVIVAPRQRNEDGTRPLTVRRFPTLSAQVLRRTPWRDRAPFSRIVDAYEDSGFDYGRSQPVAWVQSSCVLIRRAFWDRVGGFDGRYFLFMADVEICRRAWEEESEVWLLADCAVTADGRRASAGGALALFHSPALRRHVLDAGRYYLKQAMTPRPLPEPVSLYSQAAAPAEARRLTPITD